MPREIDEDLIEATIRRVAEAAAAAQGDGDTPPEDSAPVPNVLRGPAAEPAPDGEPQADGEDGDDGALERLRFDDHESFGRAGGPRRFSAQTPGGVAPSPWSPIAPAEEEDDDGATEDEPAQAATAVVEDEAEPEPAAPAPAAREDAWDDEPSEPAAPTGGRWRDAGYQAPALAAADMTAGEIAAALSEINGRLDQIVSMLDRLSPGAGPRPEWDSPRVTPLPAQRAPLSRAAVAQQLQSDEIDTRPLPQPLPPLHVEPKRGLELLPRTYRITVEDKRQGVDLVPLHRALLGMDGVKDMSLLSYNNGVAIVALEMTGDIDPDLLRASVSRAMSREAAVEQHNEHTLVVKLAED